MGGLFRGPTEQILLQRLSTKRVLQLRRLLECLQPHQRRRAATPGSSAWPCGHSRTDTAHTAPPSARAGPRAGRARASPLSGRHGAIFGAQGVSATAFPDAREPHAARKLHEPPTGVGTARRTRDRGVGCYGGGGTAWSDWSPPPRSTWPG